MYTVCSWQNHRPWHLEMLTKLVLRQSQLDSGSLQQLFSMHCPNLGYLDLSQTVLDAAAVRALAKGNWPRLTSIFLNCSVLNTTAVAQLNEGLWPRLRYNQLTGKGSLHVVPHAVLAAFVAAWPDTRHLYLYGLQVSAELISTLTRACVCLEILGLYSISVNTEKLSGYMVTPFKRLIRLDLEHSELGADAIAVLALCSFPTLWDLNLSHNQLDQASMQQLITGKWPELSHLNASFNALDNRAMETLAEGQWAELAKLELQGNAIDAVGVALVMKGHWPVLYELQLGYIAVSAATWMLLSLDPAFLVHPEGHYSVPRLLEDVSEESLIWPYMGYVTFDDRTGDNMMSDLLTWH